MWLLISVTIQEGSTNRKYLASVFLLPNILLLIEILHQPIGEMDDFQVVVF